MPTGWGVSGRSACGGSAGPTRPRQGRGRGDRKCPARRDGVTVQRPGAGAGARRSGRTRFSLRLYVAGRAPNSAAALANLRALLAEAPLDARTADLEVVDVLEEPARALGDGVIVSPTLVRLSPAPEVRIVGSLSDLPAVRAALGLENA